MISLKRIILVQFYLYDAEELELDGNTVFLGPNGSGKTSLLDAIQIAMMGAHGTYLAFNAQSIGGQSKRSIRDYCLGVVQQGEAENSPADRRRDDAITYISLVFSDNETGKRFTAGVGLSATESERDHNINGLYILPGVELRLADHLDETGEETLPLEWVDFAERTKKLCHEAQCKAYLQPHAEAYIRELLHQLQPQARHIDPRTFLKAFKNSLRLRGINSVDDFVRQHVIDEQPIDRRRAMAQIEEFRKLRQLVEQVQKQIATLDVLNGKFRNCAREHQKEATLDVLAAIYEVEHVSEELDRVEGELVEKREEHERTQEAHQRLKDEHAAKEEEYLAAARTRDPSVGEHDSYIAARTQNVLSAARSEGELLTLTDRLLGVLRRAATHIALQEHSGVLSAPLQALASVPSDLRSGDLTTAGVALSDAVDALEALGSPLDSAVDAAREAYRVAEEAFKGAKASYERVMKGGARISDTAARLIERLEAIGIEATPVCDLVSVTDRAWQPAIEAFLGGNRQSLVIEPGRERDAVAFVRRVPSHERPYGITIIQPLHLRDERWLDQEKVFVGSLLESRNATALAYVRSLFGSTRQVETEAELERYPRALTRDGMLSARGGTRSIRLLQADELLLGAGARAGHEKAARERLQEAGAALSEAKLKRDSTVEIQRDAATLADARERFDRRFEDLENLLKAIEEFDAKIARLDQEKIAAFRGKLNGLDEERKELWDKAEVMGTTATTLGAEIRELDKALNALKEHSSALRARESALKAHRDYDSMMLSDLRERYDERSFETTLARINRCREDSKAAAERAGNLATQTMPDFCKYIDEHGIALLEERSDWRLAQAWALAECTRLRESQLAQYREKVEEARNAAEQAFRNDIAFRLRESIQNMQRTLRELDRTLAACPPFSNGERYKFEAKPAEHYRALYQFIMSAADEDGQGGLFSVQDPIQDRIMELLEEQGSTEGTRTPNPLSDYRLLFTFDLLIKRDGEVISRLSKRIGSGSNGEHRTPFYVIAGAALGAAYRIAPGKRPEGAALMLLDEAFYGMDPQNALATAQFLEEIGLQLVMAGPDSDWGKLNAMCDTSYDIARDNLDVFIEPTKLKPAARQLLQSDLHFKHPELLEQKIADMKAAAEVEA